MNNAFTAALLHQEDAIYGAIKGHSEDEKHARFSVYRNNVFVSLIDALADIFPVTQQLVGDDFFRAMARAFVQGNLPTSPVISDYGQHFDTFIRDFAPAKGLPFLGDMAALEYALLALTNAEEHPTLTHAEIATAFGQVEDPATLHFTLLPHTQLMVSSFAIGSLYLAHKSQHDPHLAHIDLNTSEHLLLAKSGLYAELRVLSKADAVFIKQLMQGMTLGDAIPDDDNFDPGSSLAKLIEWNLLTRLS